MKVKVWVVVVVAMIIPSLSLGILLWVAVLDQPSLELQGMSAGWVETVGFVMMLGLAVWLPERARVAERRQAQETRKLFLAVLLADIEHSIQNSGLQDPALVERTLQTSLQKLDDFLCSESSLQIARQVLDVRAGLKQLYEQLGRAQVDTLWGRSTADLLERIQQSRVRLAARSLPAEHETQAALRLG